MKQIPKTLRFLAVFLALAFCLQILPQMVLRTWAEEIAEATATEQITAEPEASETEIVVREPEEIVSRRTETAKHFRMPDGTVLAADYPLPVHYEQDGHWVDIDNTLSLENGEFVAENDFTVRFAENGNSHKLLELSQGDYNIRFGISSSVKSSGGSVVNPGYSNDKTELTKLTSGVYYTEVMDHVDIEYQLISNRIKENIIIKEAPESYTFAFDLKLQNLSASLQEDGSIALKDGENTLWIIPAPFAYDANGDLTEDVAFTLTQKGNSGNYTLTVSLSPDWAKTAAFPIVIDPYITKTGSAGIASIAATRSDAAGNYYLSGSSDTLDVTVQSPSYIGIPTRALISSAVLKLPVKTAPAASVVVGAYEIVNGTVSTALTSKTFVAPGAGVVALDITAAVREWQSTTVKTLRVSQIQYTAGSCEMLLHGLGVTVSYNPRVSIRYYDSVGLEDYFSYSEFPLTSSAVYVKHATGQETVVMNCLSAALPISMLDVTAVYNSDPITEYSPDTYFTGLPGNNWRFTTCEYLIYSDNSAYGGESGYVYIDGDGTAHYFVKIDTNIFHDENGKGLVLSLNTTAETATLTDKSNNTKHFSRFTSSESEHTYYLTSEQTEAGHKLQYHYQTVNGKKQLYEIFSYVTEVDSDDSLVETPVEYATFSYNSDGTPYQITQFVNGAARYRTTLRYNTSGQLINIAKSSIVGVTQGATALTRLLYTDNRVTSIYDDSTRYDLTYTNNRVSLVQQFGQVNIANTAGPKVGFEYQPGITTLRTGGSDDVYGNTDDLYTSYVYDQYGHTITTHTTDGSGKVYNASTYEYASGYENQPVNYAMHKLSKTVYGGSNSFYASQTGSVTRNLLSNSSFESADYWTLASASRVTENKKMGSYGLKISGDGKASQTYTGASFNGTPKVFLVSGWAKADSMNTTDTGATFELRALVTYVVSCSGNAPITRTDTVHIPFQWLCDEWQYAAGSVVVESKEDDVVQSITSIVVECAYEDNVNTAYFDAVTLSEGIYEGVDYNQNGDASYTRSSVGSTYSYAYDENNRVTGVTRNKTNNTTETASYTYGTGRFGQYLTSANLPQNLKTEYTYNDFGQVTSSKVYSTAPGVTDSPIIRTQQVYNSQGLLTASYDARGILSETYGYSDLLLNVCAAGGTATHYDYNANETLSRTWIGTESSAGVTSANSPVTYGYNEYNPLLLETVTTPQNTYTFLHNDFGKVTQLKAGNTALVSYTYQQNYGKLASMTYANGYSEQYSYNNLGLLSALYKNNSTTPAYRYYYDANGNLTEEYESSTGNSTLYHYDTLSRLIKIELYEEEYGTYPLYTEINYDDENRVSSIYYNFEYDTLYGIATYGASDRLEKWDTYGLTRYYSYDYLQRINSVATKDVYGSTLFNTNYTFLSGWNSSAYTTTMVETEKNTALNETLKYVYDSAGRVTQVLRNNTVVQKYTYDETTGFLVREDNADAGKSYVYAYDEMGNILNRYAYAFTTGTLGSSTNTKSWYYGTSSTFGKICYGIDGQDDLWIDSFGNPYYNNETCEYFTWQGRELTYYDNSMDQYYYYTYNSDGIRTGKRMEEYAETKETVTYYLDGTQIIREIRYHVDDGTKDIFYYYDENGAPVGMSYGGPTYTYYKNIFGDILGIFDENGTLVVRYYYDAWGNIISTTGSMASTLGQDNPFRYRGYYYDTETGFYYLNARYYNPELGRFISVDGVLDVGNSVGCNLFAYCGNDPVNRIDPLGEAWWHWALGAAVVIGCAAATVITCGGFAAAATAVCFVSNGVAAATTASTVTAAAFVGSATVYGGAVLSAASVSNSVEEFNELGNWGLVAATVAGGAIGGYNGYHLANSQNALSQKEPTHNFDGSKNENYANKRGWTNEMINSAVDDGRQGTSINMANNAPCTVYRYPGTSNQYVVIENATRSVVQLSNFNDPNWIPDTRIIWDP